VSGHAHPNPYSIRRCSQPYIVADSAVNEGLVQVLCVQEALYIWSMRERLACPRHVGREMFPPKPRNFSIPARSDTFQSAALCCLPRRLSRPRGQSSGRAFGWHDRLPGLGVGNFSRNLEQLFPLGVVAFCLPNACRSSSFGQLAEFRRGQRRSRQEGWAPWFAVESLLQKAVRRVSDMHAVPCICWRLFVAQRFPLRPLRRNRNFLQFR
jgi:hypothetical protein